VQGWVPCGVGDWAVALRSPEGSLVVRVCPFDPAYWAFVDLCRQCAGNRWLPRIELAADLEGGGSVVFLEFVAPVDHPVVKQLAEQWRTRQSDPEFQEVSRAAQRIDAEYRTSTPWWGRCDLDDAHIFRAADRLVLLDAYCMAGADLYHAILEDVTEVHRWIPRERMRYALDIPYIARENSTAEILALRTAWARAAGWPPRPCLEEPSWMIPQTSSQLSASSHDRGNVLALTMRPGGATLLALLGATIHGKPGVVSAADCHS